MRIAATLIIMALLTGCAAMSPSSTDDHHRVPKINCYEAKLNGQMWKICCEQERCYLAD